jgi:arylesterase / paraoxonase
MSGRILPIVGYVALALVVVASVLTWRFLSAAGYFTGIRQEITADCRAIPAVPGPEDIAIDHERGIAYVSAYDRRAVMSAEPGTDAVRGGIYTIDLTAPQADWALRPVTAPEPQDFRPHGISLYVGPDGARRLFAVNHPAAGPETIEIFEIAEDSSLSHVRSVTSDAFISLNDVVGVGAESFYTTNDHGSRSGFTNTVTDFLLLRNSAVVYFDGEKAETAADTILYANGINVSPGGETVYVASALGMSLYIYDRDRETGALTGRDNVRLGTGIDNIDVQPDGTLLIGAHPDIIAFLSHASDPSELSPSQVVRIDPQEKKAGTIYLNLGEEISGISVAAGYGDVMLLGQVFQPEVLVCSQSAELKSY